MICEIAQLEVAPADADAMAAALPLALAVARRDPGCRGAVGYQRHEDPTRFVVVIDWDSVEAHETFRASPGIEDYRSHVGGYLVGAPTFGYYEPLGGSREGRPDGDHLQEARHNR